MIRHAREEDLATLQDVERAAGRAFIDLDMAAIAEAEPPSLELLRSYCAAGRAWVAEAEDNPIPVAYLVADIVDGNTHIEQVSVHPDHARRGIGRALIEHVAHWSRQHRLAALTLTTFVDVPWNAPYYQRCGFRPLAEDELTPGLRALRALEAAHGLDRWPRECMSREL